MSSRSIHVFASVRIFFFLWLNIIRLCVCVCVCVCVHNITIHICPSWIIVLFWQRGFHNLMKLWVMLCRATQERWVIVKNSNKVWSTGEGNGNPLQGPCLKKPMDSRERHKDRKMSLNMSPPVWKVSSMLLGKSRGQLLIAPIRKKWLGQSRNDFQLWMCLF